MQSLGAQGGVVAVSTAVRPLQVRGRFLTAVVLPVAGAPDEAYYAALDALLQQSPDFFADSPLILDMAGAERLGRQADFAGLLQQLRLRGLTPIAIQNATDWQKAQASEAGIKALPSGRETPLERKPRLIAPPPKVPEPEPAVLVTDPVRSGQRIVADRGDLVVVASVSSGAELIAHGNIHVYGSLRGRALAGVHGDRDARIFCGSLEAELIAIAGLYKTSDGLEPAIRKQRVQIFLEQESLRIRALK